MHRESASYQLSPRSPNQILNSLDKINTKSKWPNSKALNQKQSIYQQTSKYEAFL